MWLLIALAAFGTGCYGSGEAKLYSSTEEGTPEVVAPFGSPSPTPPGAADPSLPSPAAAPLPFAPEPLQIRKLLAFQYRNAIRDLLGAAAATAVTPPADSAVNGLEAIGAAQLSMSTAAVDAYERSANLAVDAGLAVPTVRAKLVPCTPANATDAACLTQVVQAAGRSLFRRTLSSAEVTAWVSVGTNAATAYGDFYRGVGFALTGLLQAPSFLYQVEVGVPDPDHPGWLKLSGLELATRLAFFLTGTSPSGALLDAAEAGQLDTPDGLKAQARLLLADAKAKQALSSFFDEFLSLRELPQLSKDPATYGSFNPALASAMAQETRLLLENLVWEGNVDFRSAFDADYTYVNSALATLYGLPAVNSAGFVRVVLPSSGLRAGVLGQAAFLSLQAHPASTSPTLRGKFVRERLLCQPVAAAPNSVNTTLPAPAAGGPQTMRDRLAAHVASPVCAGCHRQMDPIGLAFERFDAIGRHRTTDQGLAIDSTGTLDDRGAFDGSRELGGLLRADPRVTSCISRTLFRAAAGHVDSAGEDSSLRATEQAFAASGYKMKELLVELVASDAFRFAAAQVGP